MNKVSSTQQKMPLLGAVIAGGLASACCIGPLIVVLLGLGSASMFIAMEPYRPIFSIITLALMVWAAWQYRQGKKQCAKHGCASKKPILLWSLGSLALLLLVSPSLLPYLIQ